MGVYFGSQVQRDQGSHTGEGTIPGALWRPATSHQCLGKGFTAVSRQHGQGNSYTEHCLIGAGLQVRSILTMVGAWQPPGRHGAEGAEGSPSEGKQETLNLILRQLGGSALKARPLVRHFL